MTSGAPQLRFLIDASAPESVAETVEASGHLAIRHNDVLAEGTSDVVVCQTAIANNAILVAVDEDMKHLTKRFNNQSDRFKKLSMLIVSCNSVMAAKRLAQAMSVVEHEWQISQQKVACRLWFEITNHRLTTYR